MQANNVVSILGNLGADPEVKETKIGKVTKFRMAVKRIGKEAETDWVPVTLFGKIAETAATYLKKGHSVLVVGSLRIDSYDDKEGVKKTFAYIVGDNFQMMGGKKEDSDNGGGFNNSKPSKPTRKPNPAFDDDDDDEDMMPPF